MTLAESLYDYVKTCPHLITFNDIVKMSVDFSNEDEATTYSIDLGVTQPVLKRYVDGTTKEQLLFNFTSVEGYGSDFERNINNSGFFESFRKWLKTNSDNKIFPILEEDKECLSIETLTNGYLIGSSADITKAMYTIQCRLTYLQK